MQVPSRHLAIAGLCAVLGAGPAFAADSTASSCKPISAVHKRVVEKADEGVDALRNYVFITRGIHNFYMEDMAKSLDGWRADARCAQQQKIALASTPSD